MSICQLQYYEKLKALLRKGKQKTKTKPKIPKKGTTLWLTDPWAFYHHCENTRQTLDHPHPMPQSYKATQHLIKKQKKGIKYLYFHEAFDETTMQLKVKR